MCVCVCVCVYVRTKEGTYICMYAYDSLCLCACDLLIIFVFDLGFTFSFPMIQESIKKGILVTWTKSFACPDGVGQDAVRMLEDALQRRRVSQLIFYISL